MDAKYFGKWGCVIVFKEGRNIVFWQFCNRENYRNYLVSFSKFMELGFLVKSITSDKNSSLVSAVKTFYPNIPHQYCTVHIQRRCQSFLTKNPETNAGIDLLELTKFINKIKTVNDRNIFLKWLNRFETKYNSFLKQRTYTMDPTSNKKWWYTHKNVRTAFRHIKSSTNNMFFFLENNQVPKDTNGLEAEFTHLKQKLNSHRGLTRNRQQNFVNWYWFFKSKKHQKPTQNVH